MNQKKPTLTPLHRFALILLVLTAGWNLRGAVRMPVASWTWASHYEQLGFLIGLWTLVIWQAWTRPRAWGKGVGIVMILMVPLHVFMWFRGLDYFRRMGREIEFVPELLKFLPYEVFFLVTGVVCLVLGMRSALKEMVPGAEPQQES